jgi:hypothetical protein
MIKVKFVVTNANGITLRVISQYQQNHIMSLFLSQKSRIYPIINPISGEFYL